MPNQAARMSESRPTLVSTNARIDAIEIKLDRVLGVLEKGSPAKRVARKGSPAGRKPRRTKGTTSRRVRTAPRKGETIFLTKHSRAAFGKALKDQFDIVSTGHNGVHYDMFTPVEHLSTKGMAEYATRIGVPEGFKIGPGYTAVANDAIERLF